MLRQNIPVSIKEDVVLVCAFETLRQDVSVKLFGRFV
jgi:hypothetical protein